MNRSMVATNAKKRKIVDKVLQTNSTDANLVASIITMLRVRLGHTGVRKIKEGGREWLQIKDLTKVCNQFCEALGLEKREGYIKYLELGLSKIKSTYGLLTKLISMYDGLTQEVAATKELLKFDPKKGLNMHDSYVAMIASQTGLTESYVNNSTKMMYFSKAAMEADEVNCDYDTWIEAQFDALSFCKGIPSPEQLYGEKSLERLNKYLYKHNSQVKATKKIKSSDWDSILES